MKQITTIALYTVKMLRRDKIFFPAIILGVLFAFFAGMASGWSIDGYVRVLYDFGLAGFHFVGAIVAILWGAKIVGDFKNDGSIELQLASPVNKALWFIGKCFGLFIILLVIGLGLLGVWQIVLIQFNYQFMTVRQVLPFIMFIIEWWVLAAAAFFFASFATTTTSIFCTIVLWVFGLTAQPFYRAVTADTSPLIAETLKFLARFWNFQRFNLSDYAIVGEFPSNEYIGYSALFAFLLIVILLSFGSFMFHRRQLQ